MDRIQTLQVFAHVVESGSFSKAADQLNLHVSAVSKAVKYLENQLGSRLLNRTTRSLKLTAEGEAFYEKAQFLLAELEETFQDLSGVSQQAKGKLRIEMPTAIAPFMFAKLPEFQRQYPEIQLVLTANDGVSNLIDDGLDCTLRLGELADASYIARRLTDVAMQTCAAPSYVAAHGTPETLADLESHHIVHYVSGSQRKVLPWQFRKKSGETDRFKAAHATQVNDSNALLFAALAGLGIVQMPELMLRPYLANGELVPVLTALQSPTRPLWLIYPQRQFIPKRLAVFIEWVGTVFQ
ncbi:LysR family transcriptional regulator [Actinobacillus succinogenes]|uniref:Transcriptional regulator, LysR family n=1 Tax=Actinobacillus succinogenes (strain ATCC 55618 / DSM 22257 / CCUG 43843 / 130Z) TaxID=339671 RepID=A6VPW4_ACTSZ|nr:LysR family transcriptional regulator [Actinobacillus succinogenes]ABR75011.1 transcriptional regulator, LysR family [Actinobacillus succinogenes 130Z]PHI40581.1 LysR family transcriptional regulator [Actinobacillus succinogenes]